MSKIVSVRYNKYGHACSLYDIVTPGKAGYANSKGHRIVYTVYKFDGYFSPYGMPRAQLQHVFFWEILCVTTLL